MAHQQHGPKEAGGFQNVIWSTQQQLMIDPEPWRGREKNGTAG